jgi:hypothetical protein
MEPTLAYVIKNNQDRYLSGSSQNSHWFSDIRLAKLFINPPMDILWDLQAKAVQCSIFIIKITSEK